MAYVQNNLTQMDRHEFAALIIGSGTDDEHLELFNDEELYSRLVVKSTEEYENILAERMSKMTEEELTSFAQKHNHSIKVYPLK